MAEPSPQQINGLNRLLVQQHALPMIQSVFSQSFAPATQPVVNVNPRNVGLIKGFWLKVEAVITSTNAKDDLTLTDFGPSNLLSNITFTDLQNNQRVNTTGWHIALLNALKSRRPYGTASIHTTGIDTPIAFGSNFTVISAPATIAAGKTGTVIMWYWVPLAYTESDFRGAIYANVLNATMQLSLAFNPQAIALATSDNTDAVYGGAEAGQSGGITSAKVTLYQSYLDQLPAPNGTPLLPFLDLSTVYELKYTVFNGLLQGQDFPMQYSNMRDFLSTVAVFHNGTDRQGGGDVNTFALQSANFTNIWKMEPGLLALRSRNHLGCDLPKGVYYFGTREKPIATQQYGNMELVLNPKTINAGAYVKLAYEAFALQNVITGAGSLPGY